MGCCCHKNQPIQLQNPNLLKESKVSNNEMPIELHSKLPENLNNKEDCHTSLLKTEATVISNSNNNSIIKETNEDKCIFLIKLSIKK